ncbi:hypothetical protein F2Q69_00056609 [Brassica cretica]|uniref:DUF4408 domain-containing protein n=1 Tax=Brassica cretica TaxID=69181 RepID=A0A8S9MR08_BRACR|nr:hypothetical protein F2Q69_00056609 [Brassica cretica]
MDSIDFHSVKAEKANALRRFQSIGFLLRIAAEICAALLFVCWIFTSLPFAVQISGEFLRRLSSFVSTPLFMFVLTNSIVVALLTTKFTTVFSGGGAEADIYRAFSRSGESHVSSSDGDLTGETIVLDDKEMIDTETDLNSSSNSNPTVARADVTNDHPPTTTKVYKRSKTEISAKQSPEMVTKPKLRRSETEKCRETVESCEEVPFPEDNLTNEEFQKTIEAFIAKQLIFRRRESLAVVIHN